MPVAKIIDNSLPINTSPTYEISMWTSYTSLPINVNSEIMTPIRLFHTPTIAYMHDPLVEENGFLCSTKNQKKAFMGI